ncbi:hypothetical protein GQ600_26243 [Phytophthora cactorum]|nr:hypothetical protein GQ600_26243 [Phytophthora cactorum]
MTSSPSPIKEQGAADSTSMNDCVLHPPNSQLLSDHVIGGVVQRSRTSQRSYAAQISVEPRPGASYYSYTRQCPRAHGETKPRITSLTREPKLQTTQDRYLAIAELAISEKDRLRELRRKR